MDQHPSPESQPREETFDPEMTEEDEANAPDDTGPTARDADTVTGGGRDGGGRGNTSEEVGI